MPIKPKKSLYKIAAFVTLFFYSVSNCWALPGMGIEIIPARETPGFLQIEIPSDIASIEDVYEAPAQIDPKLILHVQNIHGNYESQVKIKKLLGYLYEKYGFKLIFAEGASAKLEPELLRLYPDMERNVKLADSMTKSGELTGIEYFLIDGPQDVEAVGIEETELYRKDYEAFKKVYSVKDQSDTYLEIFEAKLETLGSRIFSSNTRRILSEWRKFEEGHRDFLPYVKRLTVDAKSVLGLDLESLFAQVEWPQISRLLALQSMEKDLDQAAAQKEKKRLLEFLASQDVAPEISEAIQKLHERKITVTRTNDAEKRLEDLPRYLFERLAQEAGPKGFRFRDYPAFSLWAGHLILQNELDSKILFEEIEKVFTKVLDELTVKEEEKNLMELYRDEILLKKLLHLELTRKEWDRVVYRKDWIDIRPMVGRLKKLSQEFENTPSDVWEKLGDGVENILAETVRRTVDIAFEFYDYARKREGAFYETISNEMTSKDIDKAVVVTGGFHTDGLMDIFREKEINCSVLMPRVGGDLDTSEYVSTMMETKSVMFELATIEFLPQIEYMLDQVVKSATPSRRVARVLEKYIHNFGSVKNREELEASLNFFNETRYAMRENADVQFLLNPNRKINSIWIRYQGRLVTKKDNTIIEIPYTIEDGRVTLQNYAKAGPAVSSLDPELVGTRRAPATRAELEAALLRLGQKPGKPVILPTAAPEPYAASVTGAPRGRAEARVKSPADGAISRRDFLRLGTAAVAGALILPDELFAQSGTKRPARPMNGNTSQLEAWIKYYADLYKLTSRTLESPFAEIFKVKPDALDDVTTEFNKKDTDLAAHFAWRQLVMQMAKKLADEGYESDRVLTQKEVGLIAVQLGQKFGIPNPATIELGADTEKRRQQKFEERIGRKINGRPTLKDLKAQKEEKEKSLNFPSLMRFNRPHDDELISQAALAVVRTWLASKELLDHFKDVKPENTGDLINRRLFDRGVPSTVDQKAEYVKTVRTIAEVVIGINDAGIDNPKRFYKDGKRALYLFTDAESLSLIEEWINHKQPDTITLAQVIQRLVSIKVTYDNAERLTLNVLDHALTADSATRTALKARTPVKDLVQQELEFLTLVAKSTELTKLLAKLPATEEELTTVPAKKTYYEDIKAASTPAALKVQLEKAGIDSSLLELQINAIFRKKDGKAGIAQFFEALRATEFKDVATVRATIDSYRFHLISTGELIRIARGMENSAAALAEVFNLNTERALTQRYQGPETKGYLDDQNDGFRNTYGDNESDLTANLLIANFRLVRGAIDFEKINSDHFSRRERQLGTVLAFKAESLLGDTSPGERNTSRMRRAIGDSVFDWVINRPDSYFNANDPERAAKIEASHNLIREFLGDEEFEKIRVARPEARKKTRDILVSSSGVFVSVTGGREQVLITRNEVRSKFGRLQNERLLSYLQRSENPEALRTLLDRLNGRDMATQISELAEDPQAVRQNLGKFSGMLSTILEKAENVAVPRKPAQLPEEEFVTEEEMAESMRAGIEVLDRFLSQAKEELNLTASQIVDMITGGIMEDPVVSAVRYYNQILSEKPEDAAQNNPAVEKLKLNNEPVTVVLVLQTDRLDQASLLDPKTGLLVSASKLLLANPKALVHIVLAETSDTEQGTTQQFLSNLNLTLNTLQASLGDVQRLQVTRASADPNRLFSTLSKVRRQLMMTRNKMGGTKITQLQMQDSYAEVFISDNIQNERMFGQWVTGNSMADSSQGKLLGLQLSTEQENRTELAIGGLAIGLLKARETATNRLALVGGAESLRAKLPDILERKLGFQGINPGKLGGIIKGLILDIQTAILTSRAA